MEPATIPATRSAQLRGLTLVPKPSAGEAPSPEMALLDSLPCAAMLESDGFIVAGNGYAAQLLGCSLAQPLATQSIFLGGFPHEAETAEKASEGVAPSSFQCLLLCRTGRPVAIHGAAQLVAGSNMRLIIALPLTNSTAERREAPDGAFLSSLLDAAPEAMALTFDGRLLHVNREFCRLFGFPRELCIGQELHALLMPEPSPMAEEKSYRGMDASGAASLETQRRTREGEWIDVSILVGPVQLGGRAQGLFYTFRDIRPQKEAEARLQHWAMHDALTDLPNRSLFRNRLRQALALLERDSTRTFAILFLDLDGFKAVNDTWGHSSGDTVLFEIADRLRECVRPQDTVARFGGDEFALLLASPTTSSGVQKLAKRLQQTLAHPVSLEGGHGRVSASIGVALIDNPGLTPEQAMHMADVAMYNAKAEGKARHQLYTPAMSLPRAS